MDNIHYLLFVRKKIIKQHQTKSKKNMNKSKLRKNPEFKQTRKSRTSESRLLRKDNHKPSSKSNQSKTRISGWRNRITRKESEQDIYIVQACNRYATTATTQIVESLTLSGRIILSYSSDYRMTRHSVFTTEVLSETFFSQTYIYWGNIKNVKHKIFWVLTLKMLFAPIFMVISVISKSKYVAIQSFKAIEGIYLAFGSTPSTSLSQSAVHARVVPMTAVWYFEYCRTFPTRKTKHKPSTVKFTNSPGQ